MERERERMGREGKEKGGEERIGEGRREEKQGKERKRSKSGGGGVMARAEKKGSHRVVEQSQKSKRSAFLKRKFGATSETPVVGKPTEYA